MKKPAPPPPTSPPPSSGETTRAPRRGLWLAAATVSGCAWFLAAPDFDLWPLAWIASVPSFYAIERAPTTRRAVFYGWWTGVVMNAGGFYWIVGLLERFAHLPTILALPIFGLMCAYQGLIYGLFAWATRRVRAFSSLPMALIAPMTMVASELVVPLIFPYYLAITQAWIVPVIQVADLAGPLGVTALLLLANGAIYDLVTQGRRRLVAASVAASVLLAALGYGQLRIAQVSRARAAAPKIDVGVVQPNVAFDQKGVEKPQRRQAQLRDLQARSAELEAAGADLVVWTESSYPYVILRHHPGDFPENDARRIRRGFAVPLLFGAVTATPTTFEDPDEYPYNTALLLDREGRFAARFDKIFLLMFGEYIPGLETFPWIRKLLPKAAGHFARGQTITTFPFRHADGREYRLGPMICYEDILPVFGRKLAALRPHLLVNLTNDAWFGDTSEPWEHLALSVFRSVELRTDLVRAVNTGVSAFIDATGRVYAKTYAVDPARDPRPADKLLAEAALLEGGHTVYARVGDLFGYLCLAGTGWLALFGARWRPRLGTCRRPRLGT